MSDNRPDPDVSPIDNPRTSNSTATQSGTDFRAGQDETVNRRPQHSNNGPPLATSANIQVSQSAAEDTVVRVEAPDPAAGNGAVQVMTIRPDHTQTSSSSPSRPPPATVQPPSSGSSAQANLKPLQQALQKQSYTYPGLIRTWRLELLALLLAAIVVVIIVVVLHYYHDRDVRSWNHNWAINSVFAFLTAIMEASVAFAVGSALGQLRWLWYTKHHSQMQLKWMDRLTNARSAPGAARFAIGNIRTTYRHWAVLGAALIVSLLGVGVFTQNVIKIRGQERDIQDMPHANRAKTPVARNYVDQWEFGSSGESPGDQMPNVNMDSAITAGFTFPAATLQKDVVSGLVHCSTGNCTFGLYSSLSLCSQCIDISDQLQCRDAYRHPKSCPKNARVQLPDNSISLDPNIGVVNITSDDQYPMLSNMTGVGPLVARYVGMGYWNTPALAQECALYWCVQTYNASVVSNNFLEFEVQSWTNLSSPKTFHNQSWDIELYADKCYRDGQESQDCHFRVDSLSQLALQNYLIYGSTSTNSTGFLRGHVTIPPGSDGKNWVISSLAANTIISPCLVAQNCTVYQHSFYMLYDSFQWMQKYMSNTIRESIGGYSYGTTSRFDTYFHVRWGWLAYPVAVVLISIIFLVVTIWKSRGVEPWKSSVTALLFHGLTDEDRAEYMHLNDPVAMREADDWVVTLQDHHGTRSFKIKAFGSHGRPHHDGGDFKDGVVNVANAMLKASEGLDL